jgi:hypothetical protein
MLQILKRSSALLPAAAGELAAVPGGPAEPDPTLAAALRRYLGPHTGP